MPAKERSRVTKAGSCIHIYNTGVDNRLIFKDEQDYETFINYLQSYLVPANTEKSKRVFTVKGQTFKGVPHLPKNYFNKVELIGYGLGPSRFDLILRQVTAHSVENFLRSLCTRYSIYFNKKHKRNGSLFAGPYRSIYIKDTQTIPESILLIKKTSTHSSWITALKPTSSILVRSGINAKNLTRSYLPVHHRIPEIISIGLIFALLTVLGLKNINASFSPKPSVAGTSLIIRITESETSIPVYESNSIDSKVVARVQNGDKFEYFTSNSEWYEISLSSNTTGFVSAKYVYLTTRD